MKIDRNVILAWPGCDRRAFLGRSAGGIGSLALASLLDPALLRAGDRAKSGNAARSRRADGKGRFARFISRRK